MRFAFVVFMMLWGSIACADDYCLPGYVVFAPGGGATYRCQIQCHGGTYLANINDPECTNVGSEYWAPESIVIQGHVGVRNKCPSGLTTSGYGSGADEESDCGHALHLGDSVLHLGSRRMSTPGLNFLYNGKKYYAGATKLSVGISNGDGHTLNIMDKNRNKYFIYDTTMKDKVIEQSTVFDPDDYVIDDGKIISANPNVYIESTGGQYIDTRARGNTRYKYELVYQPTTVVDSTIWGMRNVMAFNGGDILSYSWQNYIALNGALVVYFRPSGRGLSSVSIPGANNLSKAHIIIDIPNNVVQYNNNTLRLSSNSSTDWETEYDLFLFSNNVGGKSITKPVSAKIYSYKVYDADDKLIMHMVPVPCGLQIGNVQIPRTGMWDIVTQTYYQNAGDGFFLYGKDE